MGRCVEHYVGAICAKNTFHPGFIADIREERDTFHIGHFGFTLTPQAKKHIFGSFDKQQSGRAVACGLSHKFGADGTARAGYHYAFIGEKFMQIVVVKLYGVAAKQVFDPNVTNPVYRNAALRYFIQARNYFCANGNRPADFKYCANLAAARLINGNDYLFGGQFRDEARQIRDRTQHLVSAQACTMFLGVIINKSANFQRRISPAGRFARKRRADTACAGDDGRLTFRPPRRREKALFFGEFVEQPPQHTQSEQTAEAKHGVNKNYGHGHLPQIKIGEYQYETKRNKNSAGN